MTAAHPARRSDAPELSRGETMSKEKLYKMLGNLCDFIREGACRETVCPTCYRAIDIIERIMLEMSTPEKPDEGEV